MTHRALSWLALALAALGCTDQAPSRAAPPAVRPHAPTAPTAPALASSSEATEATEATEASPPAPEPEFVHLEVPGWDPAVVALPRQGRPRHPLVLAAHGNFDRPMWECAYWRRLFPNAFVFCPRGVLREDSPSDEDPRYTYDSVEALGAETAAGLEALERRFGGRVDIRRAVWAGLSRGAYLGAALAPQIGARFTTMVLVEGGHDPWIGDGPKRFVEAGGERVLFVCGRAGCVKDARKAAYVLEHHGAGSRIELVPGMGHGLNEDALGVIGAALPWLLGES